MYREHAIAPRKATPRKSGPCSHCDMEIAKGERVRRQTSKFDGELMTHRWCALCCSAMANYEARSGLAKRQINQGITP